MPDPKDLSPSHWMTYTKRVLTLSEGSWIAVEDDPNLGGGYLAIVHVDLGGYSDFEASRGEIEELDEASAWALATYEKLLEMAEAEAEAENEETDDQILGNPTKDHHTS